jgi:hypothetical protein
MVAALAGVAAAGLLVGLWTVRGPRDGDGPGAATTPPAEDLRLPPVGVPWQYQLSGTLDLDVDAVVFDVDGEETSAEDVARLHDRGAYVVCYISAGSHEDWRSDAADYPDEVLGEPLDDWPGERWVDIRRTDVLLPLLERRMETCREKGFDAVELDNVDAYGADTGFPLTAEDQLAFNRAIADAAHRTGLAVGLKNDPEQVAALVDDFDFAVVEECASNDECDAYAPFVEAGKPVFLVEYALDHDEVCAAAREHGFSAITKDLDLEAPVRGCDGT